MVTRKLTSASELLYGTSNKGALAEAETLNRYSSLQRLEASSLPELTELLQQIYEELPAESSNKKLIIEVSSLAAAASASGNKGDIARAKDEVIEALEHLKRYPDNHG